MNGNLAIHIYGISSKVFASQIVAEIISEGKKVKEFTVRTFGEVSKLQIRKIADAVKKKIDRNLRLGMRFDGKGKVAKLAKSTIEAKKRKGRTQPERVFLDSGILFGSLRIVPIARGFAVNFAQTKYPKTGLLVGEVATYLNNGTSKMPERPFFGIIKSDFEKLVNQFVGIRRVKTTKVTGKDIIEVRNLAGQIISVKKQVPPKPIVKAKEFVPAKTAKEAEEWAVKNLTGIEKVSFEGLNIVEINEVSKEILSLQKKYGKLGKFHEIKTVVTNKFVARMDRGRVLELNVKSFKNETFKRSVEAGIDKMKPSVAGIIDHEIGHALTPPIFEFSTGAAVRTEFGKSLLKFFNANKDRIKSELTEYAATAPHEFIAEAFAAREAGMAPKWVLDYLKSINL